MNAYARRFEADIRTAARAEGIALTPAGQALFARDAARLAELRAADQRTPAEIADDDAAQAAICAHAIRGIIVADCQLPEGHKGKHHCKHAAGGSTSW